MTKDEALDLALEALDNLLYWDNGKSDYDQAREAITAIRQARALDKKAENARELGLDYEPVQDSTCNETLRAQGKAYPRTCRKCGKGPCIGAPKPPPAQPALVQSCYCPNCEAMVKELAALKAQPAPVQDIEHCIWARNGNTPCPHTTPPAAQPAVPDAMTSADIQEHIEYVAGWNDCRQAMLEMMK